MLVFALLKELLIVVNVDKVAACNESAAKGT